MLEDGKVWMWIYHHPVAFLIGIALLIVLIALLMGIVFEMVAPPRPSTDATLDAIRATLQLIPTPVNK